MFCFRILACCHSLFICDSNLCSLTGFNFQSVVFKGTLIFSQNDFAPSYFKSFNFVMPFVEIFVNKLFTFLVLDLTVLQSWFLRDGNVVFFSDMILLMVFTLVFFSWVSVCVCMFVVYGSLSCSVWSGVWLSCIYCLGYCGRVCGCVCIYISWWISSISRPENQPFFIIVLTWSVSLWFVALNLPNSVQISIILFLYPLFAGLLLK